MMMELTPIFNQYKIIKLHGYSNGNIDYQKAKTPVEKWQTAQPLTDAHQKESLKNGYWLGSVIPEGYIVIDIDSKEKGKIIYEGLLRAGYSLICIKTPNGYQFVFRDTGQIKNQGSKRLTLGGIAVDYRLAGKGYIVMPTENTPGRTVIHNPDSNPDSEPDLIPLMFLPVRGIKESDTQLDIIPEGMRDSSLISHASKVREWNKAHNLNLRADERKQVLNEINSILCYPPLPPPDIDRIFKSAESYPTISSRKEGRETIEALPAVLAKSLMERIAEASQNNYSELIQDIADLEDEIQKEILCKALSKKLEISFRTVRNAVKAFEKDKELAITDSNIILTHPSYDIQSDFAVLGFRETIVSSGNEPQDRNFYIISTDKGFRLHDDKVLHLHDKHILFDERERFLLRAEDRWKKESILSFINNPISPTGLYHEIKQVLKQYVEFQKEAIYGLVAAWILSTYFFLIFHAFPFLFIYGKKLSGKSRVLDLLERLSFNAMKIKGISVAGMADSIDGVRGTFLNDQAEALSDPKNAELLGILADSYTPGGGKRRIVDISNKRRRVLEFETYAPKAFASIKEIDPDLKDRCIEINMLRALKDYPYPEAFLPIWHDMRDKFYRLLLTRWREAREIYETTGQGVSHRVRELWKPLETILRLENVSADEMQGIKDFFLASMLETQAELSDSEIDFFEILLEKLEATREGIFTVDDITKNIKTRPREDMTDKGLQTWAGRMLRQFSLYDRQEGRKGKRRAYHFSYDHVKDIFNRYHLTGGIGGEVVNMANLGHLDDTTYQNRGGNEVVNIQPVTTFEPPVKTEVVTPEPLINKTFDHLSTSTTYTEGKKIFKVSKPVEVIQ